MLLLPNEVLTRIMSLSSRCPLPLPRSVFRGRSYATATSNTKASKIPIDLQNLPPAAVRLNVRLFHQVSPSLKLRSFQFRTLPVTPKAGLLVGDKPPHSGKGPASKAFIHHGNLGKTSAYAWTCEYFTMRVIPHPTQPEEAQDRPRKREPSSPFPSTPERVYQRDLGTPAPVAAISKALQEDNPRSLTPAEHRSLGHHRHTMDLTIPISKKNGHKLSSIRTQIRQRIMAAIRLAVQQGIASDAKGGYTQDLTERGIHHWLLPHHKYILHPKLECFLLPLPDLLHRIRLGLKATRVSRSMVI